MVLPDILMGKRERLAFQQVHPAILKMPVSN
jgi:hypothetical protein